MGEPGHETRLGLLLDQLRLAENDQAREQLIDLTCGRMRRLAATMLRRCPELRRWEQTDDVVQGAALRLHQTLQKIRPGTAREFCGLMALHVRRELIDLLRKARGPQGIGANHATWDSRRRGRLDARADTAGPATLCWWTEFHRQAAALPACEREVFELVYYQGLTHAEAAALLGTSERTCKRHYRNAKLQLHAALADGVTDEPGT